MATLLDAPKPAPRYDDLVEKRFGEVQRRIRLLDLIAAGLWLFLGTMVFLFAVLLIDRHVETPPGTGWATFAVYLGLAGGFLYWSLFRPSRRRINPYYVAKQVEATLPNAKNSVVNWVDLHDDERLDVAIRHAVSSRAGKDLKTVDVDRAIERTQVVWLAGFGVFAFVVASVMYFLPPLRTRIELLQPETGDSTIFSTQDFRLSVGLKGRIPEVGRPDAARLRVWYNPDDPDTFEDRPLDPSPDDRTKWDGFVSARQTRNGFVWQILCGKAATPKYTLSVRILPVVESFEVKYEYPDYVNESPKTVSDPNLIGYYGTKVSMAVRTNCELKSGQILVNGGEASFPATIDETDKQTLHFQFALEHQGRYRLHFTTVEGEKNTEVPNPKMTLLDPTPMFTRFDIGYHYPAYLRWKDETVVNVKNPKIEAIRGTRVTLTAHANRPVREAGLRFPEVAKLVPGEGIPGKAQSIKFELPPLDRDGEAQLWFSPTTVEKRSEPITIKIVVRPDHAPEVRITKPDKPEIELPANAALSVDGFATDDFGVKSMALKMKLVSPVPQELADRPYREGKDFLRAKDKSYPIRIDYKDTQKLPELKTNDGKPVELKGGEVLEYWLEALDNCDVPPAPHKGESQHQRVKILPPKKDDPNQQKQDQNRQQEEKQNNDNQDQKNENDERNPNQPPPQGGENQDKKEKPDNKEKQPDKKDQQPDKKNGEQGNQDPQKKNDPNQENQNPAKKNDPNQQGGNQEKKEDQPGEGQRNEEQTKKDAQDLQNKLDQQKAQDKPGPKDQGQQKQEKPADAKPEGNGDKKNEAEDKPAPKPNQEGGKEGGPAGGDKKEGKVEKTPKSEEKGKGDQKQGENPAGEDKQEKDAGGGKSGRGDGKPQGKPEPKGNDGAEGQKEKTPGQGKGEGNQKRPDADPTKPENRDKVAAGGDKPEPKEGRGQQKAANSEPQGDPNPPQDVASNKAEKSEKPADAKPAPNPMQAEGAAENKPNLAKKEGVNDPKSKPEGETKPEGKPDPMQNQTAKGDAKPEKKDDGQGGNESAKKDPPKLDPKQLREMANDLKDPQKREDALKKMQDLAGDKQAREEAKKQLDEMMKNATEQEKKEIADAMKDLEKAIKGNDNGGSDKQGPKENAKNEPKEGPGENKPKKEIAKEGQPGKEGETKPGPEKGKEEVAANPKPNGSGEPKNGESKESKEPKVDPNQNPKEPGKEIAKESDPKKGDPKESEPKKGLAKNGDPKEGNKPPEGEAKPNQPGQQNQKVIGGRREGEAQNTNAENDPMLADKKNRLKAGQMQLEKFKANEKTLREEKNWDKGQWEDFVNDMQKMLNRQKDEITQLEKQGGSRTTGPSSLNGSERIKLDERGGSDPLQGSKFVAPPGFSDPYKQFTGDLSGLKKK